LVIEGFLGELLEELWEPREKEDVLGLIPANPEMEKG
jgi:hypothetical protein